MVAEKSREEAHRDGEELILGRHHTTLSLKVRTQAFRFALPTLTAREEIQAVEITRVIPPRPVLPSSLLLCLAVQCPFTSFCVNDPHKCPVHRSPSQNQTKHHHQRCEMIQLQFLQKTVESMDRIAPRIHADEVFPC